MRTLALDIATHVGWAHTCGDSGVQDFSLRRGDSPGMRFLYFRAWLTKMVELVPTDLIVYEQAGHHRSGAATHVCHGMIAVAEAVAADHAIDISARPPMEIKKHALGYGGKKANKARMVQAAENRWPGIEIINDDHADALHLLDLVLTELGLPNKFDGIENGTESGSAKK